MVTLTNSPPRGGQGGTSQSRVVVLFRGAVLCRWREALQACWRNLQLRRIGIAYRGRSLAARRRPYLGHSGSFGRGLEGCLGDTPGQRCPMGWRTAGCSRKGLAGDCPRNYRQRHLMGSNETVSALRLIARPDSGPIVQGVIVFRYEVSNYLLDNPIHTIFRFIELRDSPQRHFKSTRSSGYPINFAQLKNS